MDAFRLTLAAVLLVVGVGCSDGKTEPTPSPPVTLPPGTLSSVVVQPDEVPDGLVLLAAQSGPADLGRIAGFSQNAAAATKQLTSHGFRDAYIATYGDPASGRVVSSVVVRFASETGAAADLAADLGAAAGTGTAVDIATIGDESGAVRNALDTSGSGDLITARFRVDDLTFLLAIGARGDVEPDAVEALGKALAARAEDFVG